ncbi:MAG: glycosyltransferase [Bacteroidales bacterium]
MMNHSLVSVIIPIYNMQDYLEETIQSVLKSSYPNVEIILMDDGSTDKSAAIARKYAEQSEQIHFYEQSNLGVIAARNHAIEKANGIYIFPLDADDLLHPGYLSDAVNVLDTRPDVKVVCSQDLFFGDRSQAWHLPDFSLGLLARKNIIAASALYRKSDWKRVGGYCREIIAREDWEFWIAILKDGGEVVRLAQPGISYRIRRGSKRVSDRKLKRHVVAVLNKRHPEFFQRELGGPLRNNRSWSKCINRLAGFFNGRKFTLHPDFSSLGSFMNELPERFIREGEFIYQGRNELKKFTVGGFELIVKSYQRPIFINRIIYGFLRASKAERSYAYALKFLHAGIGSPMPVGFLTVRRRFLLDKSYFVSLKSTCNLQYTDFKKQKFVHEQEILEAIGRTTAIMHENGFLHKDYSAGNILFRDELPVPIEIIDLNRMRFHPIDMTAGCKNFERLPGSPGMFAAMGRAYARERRMDEKECISLIQKFHD